MSPACVHSIYMHFVHNYGVAISFGIRHDIVEFKIQMASFNFIHIMADREPEFKLSPFQKFQKRNLGPKLAIMLELVHS